MSKYDNENYAGFWIRALARIIDNLLIGLIVFVLFLMFFGLDATDNVMNQTFFAVFFLAMFVISFFAIGYLISLLYVGAFIIVQVLNGLNRFSSGDTRYFITKVLLFLIISIVGYTLYHVLLNMRGGTLGKMAAGIEIKSEETQEYLPFGKALGRFFALEALSGFVFGLGFLWAAWDTKKQTWHDKLARTIVVKKTAGFVPSEIDSIIPPIHSPSPMDSDFTPKKKKVFGELVFTAGRMTGKHFPLGGDKVVIGRGDAANVVLIDPDKKMSREQFEIYKRDTRYFIRNLSRKQNTMLNGRKIEGDISVKDNDEISVYDFKMRIKLF